MNKELVDFATESSVKGVGSPVDRISFASEICVILTEKCNIRCRHCVSNCSPSRNEDLDLSILESFLRQAAESEFVNSVGFSGGEPFIDIARLEYAAGLCGRYGLDFDVTTNSFWAKDVASAKNILLRLRGLSRLCLSTDIFHQEFIPSSYIVNAINACNELNIDCCVVVTYLKNSYRGEEIIRRELRGAEGAYTIQQWPALPVGRASNEINHADFLVYDSSEAVCATADTPMLNVHGELIACCGPAIHWPRGNLLNLKHLSERPLDETLKSADQDSVIQALRVWGPAYVFRLVSSLGRRKGSFFKTTTMDHMCSICKCLLADPYHAELVQQALESSRIRRELAVTRMAKLGEVSMFIGLSDGG